MESKGDHEMSLLLLVRTRAVSFTALTSLYFILAKALDRSDNETSALLYTMKTPPSCFTVLPLALLLLLVLQASPSAGVPAMRTLAVPQAEGGEHTTPPAGGRKGRGRYDYVYECAKCDDDSTDIGATVYAYDG
ncbi:uncharacterized protein LOC125944564 [Dermacentor silvarum]|uniref:uncharacterized protein LOC125944564 n=1 Tax=Dermacentor silvarum TaxID=543639 RepID=UPI002100849A|nr:uncharacterized protein LOC125944564 [Dermacentor silvarum]